MVSKARLSRFLLRSLPRRLGASLSNRPHLHPNSPSPLNMFECADWSRLWTSTCFWPRAHAHRIGSAVGNERLLTLVFVFWFFCESHHPRENARRTPVYGQVLCVRVARGVGSHIRRECVQVCWNTLFCGTDLELFQNCSKTVPIGFNLFHCWTEQSLQIKSFHSIRTRFFAFFIRLSLSLRLFSSFLLFITETNWLI